MWRGNSWLEEPYDCSRYKTFCCCFLFAFCFFCFCHIFFPPNTPVSSFYGCISTALQVDQGQCCPPPSPLPSSCHPDDVLVEQPARRPPPSTVRLPRLAGQMEMGSRTMQQTGEEDHADPSDAILSCFEAGPFKAKNQGFGRSRTDSAMNVGWVFRLWVWRSVGWQRVVCWVLPWGWSSTESVSTSRSIKMALRERLKGRNVSWGIRPFTAIVYKLFIFNSQNVGLRVRFLEMRWMFIRYLTLCVDP